MACQYIEYIISTPITKLKLNIMPRRKLVTRNQVLKSLHIEELRGIKNDLFTSDSAIVINIDLPIKVVQTDWVNFFNYFGLNWNWTRLFDFELQLSPFFDMSLCKNVKTGTQYLIEDGFYSCGLEMLVFPNKMKSIVGRVSLGVDAVKTLDKIGNKISFVDKVTNRVFNTEWRSGYMWELFIGIGLFY